MRKVQSWLDEYALSHQNFTNKIIHWICVPFIVWSIVALFWSIPVPVFLYQYGLNWAYIVMFLAGIYYMILSPALGLGMILFLFLLSRFTLVMESTSSYPLWGIATVVFVAAWIGQFFGHKIEGQKPSFLKDVQFLLIGPLWLMHFIYRKIGIPY